MIQVEIAKLAKLSALKADNSIQIDSVLESFNAIELVKTDDVSSFSRSGKSEMSLREDIVQMDESLPDKLLACSPQKIAAHQVVLSGIMHGE